MGLSRLENFLKSARGTILYVDPGSIDSTDSIENSGNSLTRPFKTIQRALVEAARFSYQRGLNNDRFGKTTILVYPGEHVVDNRPGYIPTGANTFKNRAGQVVSNFSSWDYDTEFDLTDPDNVLYKLNSVHGGVIVPRGTSIVGMDLRKTVIRPTYVPNPVNDDIERSAIFRVTGSCYFWQFTILDANPNDVCYKDYTKNQFVPNFSHHKLTGFEYADGVNGVYINDEFLYGANKVDTTRTDLDMYYEKVGLAYGPSFREIPNDYPSTSIDIQPVIDEYRIVGSLGETVGITSIRSGNGVTPSTIVTVDFNSPLAGLNVDSPIKIQGVSEEDYDGQHVVSTVASSTRITYRVQNPPSNPLPSVSNLPTLSLVSDTVNSSSPYIFNISLRSVYGMCGLLADGDKATGFKSMVVAQYTAIGLQKDDEAFAKYQYNSTSGEYKYSSSIENLNTDSQSKYKPTYENFHIKATNDAFLQLVSVFSIGYAQHFVSENGGDIAINNSNSNFGAKALVASGFKKSAFESDDYGYITHIIPPKQLNSSDISVEFLPIDVGMTTSKSAGAATTTRLYLYGEENLGVLPKVIVDGYHIGAKQGEKLNSTIFDSGITTTYSSTVVMPNGPYNTTQVSSEKSFSVGRSNVGINSISSNIITLTENHSFINGESIRVTADNGYLPDGLESDQIYYAITKETRTTLGINQICVAKSLNNARNGATTGSEIVINNKGGQLKVVSRVIDKNPGEIGHPVQWDSDPSYENWYVNVTSSNNEIYSRIRQSGVVELGTALSRTYVTRVPYSRGLNDSIYRVRYVIPKESPSSTRPPTDGFILQESNNIVGSGTTEISLLYSSSSLSDSNSFALRNPKFIAGASWSSNNATIRTETRHNLSIGDTVEIVNVSPDDYNGTYQVTSIPSEIEFRYALVLDTSPSSFSNDTSSRTSSLPYFRRKKYSKTYQVYRIEEIQPFIKGSQDGIYHLIVVNASNKPNVTPFTDKAFTQPIENLFPQVDRDNPISDPKASSSYALPDIIGKVVVDDVKNSITKETIQSFVGFGITNIRSSSGTAHTIYTEVDHGLAGITSVSIVSAGSRYGPTFSPDFSGELYNARLVGFAGSTTGSNATAKITVTSGSITGVTIINGGSAYGIGNTLTVVGVATTTGHVVGVVQVQSITNNIDDTLQISGVSSERNNEYNTLYRVSSISTGRTKELSVVSANSISQTSSAGIGSIVTLNSNYVFTGKSLRVSTFAYNSSTGRATITFNQNHPFRVNNKIKISGADQSVFNTDYVVTRINSLSSLDAYLGITTTSTSATGTIYGHRPYLTSTLGDLTSDIESVSGRLNYEYAGITTTLTSAILSTDTTNLNVTNANILGFKLGDFILIDDEIMRIKSAVTSSSIPVIRGVLGTPKQDHVSGRVVQRIKITPVELRRNSIIRASGHTFEYLGYGPGNYSTSLPQKQDRDLSNSERLLAQSTKTDGGLIVYTGMDSDGNFYAGNKKINSATGKEENFEYPIPTISGEKSTESLSNIAETQKLFATNSIKVDGGKDKNSISEFDGPVIFNNKVTSYSDIETNRLLIQGDEKVSRRISISTDTPTNPGTYGDLSFNSEPSLNEFVGWTYVTENKWEPFGFIGQSGVGIASGGNYLGIATLINLVTSGIALSATRSSSGITTVSLTASNVTPRIGISSGTFNTFVGLATQINFVGYGATVRVTSDSITGIATVTVIASTEDAEGTPGTPLNSIQYNNAGDFGGISIFTYNDANNSLLINGSSSSPILSITQSGSGDALRINDSTNDTSPVIIKTDGKVGLGTTNPNASLDILVTSQNQTALLVRSLRTSGDLIRIEDQALDTSPFIIDVNGNVGIKTNTLRTDPASGSTCALDLVGAARIDGSLNIMKSSQIRFYENESSSEYVGFKIGSVTSNVLFTLPTTYGSANQVLFTSGSSGVLGWQTVSRETVAASTGISVSKVTGSDGMVTATLTNTGVTKIVAGDGITINPTGGTGTVTITSSGSNLYPFTTRGFAWLL